MFEIVFVDQAIAVSVDEIQAGRGAPMSQQARLDVFDAQRLGQQRICVKIDLSDGEIVRGAPIGVDLAKFFTGERHNSIVVQASLISHEFHGGFARNLEVCVSSSVPTMRDLK